MSNSPRFTDIKSLFPEEIEELCALNNLPRYRAEQIFRAVSGGAAAFSDITVLPPTLRETLAEKYSLSVLRPIRCQKSAQDGTEKILWALQDGQTIETVLMKYSYGNTVCISTQAGCRMGCAFCASTLGGKIRDLLPGEMLEEVIRTEIVTGAKISNIVLMGIGEPLDNYDNVIRFLKLVNHPRGRNIGMRHISLSTCGVVPGIQRLAKENLQITLSVSLHAPDNETRNKIMPVNRAYDIHSLMDACEAYFSATGRRISFEYALIDGVNSSEEHARKLARLLKKSGAHVNLIRLNYVSERGLKPCSPEALKKFSDILSQAGITVTVRRKLGRDIDAACGQLRHSQTEA